jgi:choline dehydrogenase-like flavoprotein
MRSTTTEQIPRRHCAEVAIIGFGMVGAVLARELVDAGTEVLVADSGSAIATPAGTHLRNVPACRADRVYYHELVRAALRPASVPRPKTGLPGHSAPSMPDGLGVNSAQSAPRNLSAARVTNALGGMGVLWNCVAPRLHAEIEHWPGIRPDEWEPLYARAEQLLGVGLPASGGRQDHVLAALAEFGARPSPIARPAGRWTGPAEVISPAALAADLAVQRLVHRGGRVVAAEAVALDTGERVTIEADVFVVATGGLRTPALLWASGIHADDTSALGRYLSDHPITHAQVVLDHDAEEAGADPFVIIPIGHDRPFHALALCGDYPAERLEGRIDDRLILSLYWYSLSRQRRDNRITFTRAATDATGLPQPTFSYRTDETDREVGSAALADLVRAAERLGAFLPGSGPRVLAPGSSMHVMGTTRMGVADDGDSVTDTHGLVWGFDNLYLGGTGLIPSATATNPTLAACALAVRTAGRVRQS